MRARSSRPWVSLVVLSTTALACGDSNELPEIGPQDARWESVIERHTRGEISRRDRVRVVFATDVVDESRVGTSATDLVTLQPEIPASVTFASQREVVVAPEGELDPGTAFVVSVSGDGLDSTPEDLEPYRFLVRVMEQGLDVTVTGLTPDPDVTLGLVLTGSVVTADADDADRIEDIVRASLRGRDLDVTWEHEPDGRRHRFSVGGITRGDVDEEMTLAWTGAPIGVETAGDRRVAVPASGLFAITRVDAVQDQRQYVLIQFSDPIDPAQNLSGLVTMSGGEFTTGVEGNQIRLYPAEPMLGDVTVILQAGIRSADGKRLEQLAEETVAFAQTEPGVRFVGSGSILPATERVTVPIEAVNVRSVQVTAFAIPEDNIGQFLQTNALGGSSELGRVGRYLWRRTLPLASPLVDQWNRYSLDLTDLMAEHRSGIVRLTLSIHRGNSTYTCPESDALVPVVEEAPLVDLEEDGFLASQSWEYVERYPSYSLNLPFDEREDPCKDAYYRWSGQAKAARNFVASNLGLLAKRDELGSTLVTVTDLRTSEPESGVRVTFMSFQNQPIGEVVTDEEGVGRIELDPTPFYALAEKAGDRAYLRMSVGAALATSHFDVGGAAVAGGLKGIMYTERGVWRPGDSIHVTLVLQDEEQSLPADHPATLQLFDPRGQRVRSITHTTPTNGFYSFALATDAEAPTGTWNAAVEVGGSRFTRSLKVETVIPNRLRVELDPGVDGRIRGGEATEASIFAQWLSGALARDLRADVTMRLVPSAARFDGFEQYRFDDPARTYSGEDETLFEGFLGDDGRAGFELEIEPSGEPAGFLTASFTSRVFERGGAFSTNRSSAPVSPYRRYVGVRLPGSDTRRGALLTDTTHSVEIVTVDDDGAPAAVDGLRVTVYKVQWRWWWDRSRESLAQFATSQHRAVVDSATVSTVGGRGTFPLRIDYPAWGRYLIRVCDPEGRHCTGDTFYVDWPGWAGRPRDQPGMGANVLAVTSDREAYSVGDVARIELPESSQGRALVTLENGSHILDARWLELEPGRATFDVPITPEMSPTVYVGVTLIQPHEGRANDLPLRLYGVLPLAISDPRTHLAPVLEAADEWRPETQVAVSVSESSGRPMTYTVAVVDEGLLSLTNFETPELHGHFYRKEALGVRTWDLFDEVVGAYGGELERLLALGGDDGAELEDAEQSRYPPVVRFLGPFELDARGRNEHRIDLPQYIGAVRVMVVAGQAGAYGSTAKSVFVREPLSLLATLPRVVGPDEEIALPVSLFAMTEDIREATVRVETDEHFSVVGSPSATVEFDEPGEEVAFLRLRVGSELGQGRILVSATSGEHSTRSELFLTVRTPNPPTVRRQQAEIAAGESWSPRVEPHGLPGTNRTVLELTTLPPLNLEARLQHLVRSPHGSLEHLTSSAFPQLYLPGLVFLEPARRTEVNENVRTAIDRLRGFALPDGSFTYWPGGFGTGYRARDSWVTSYTGHFLIEAERRGFFVPPGMKSDWLGYQRSAAQAWAAGGEAPAMDQAYRLYTLALAGRPEMGAMNRLRESDALDYVSSWHLAAAYGLAGLDDVARQLARAASRDVPDYREPGWSFGSRVRDLAIRLNALVVLEMDQEADSVARVVSDELYSNRWHSTHTIAYALMAMAELYGVDPAGAGFTFQVSRAGQDFGIVRAETPIYSMELAEVPLAGEALQILNTAETTLYSSVVVEGIPAAGDEEAAGSGLQIRVDYLDTDDRPIDVRRLDQGTDFAVRVRVTNPGTRPVSDLALEHRVPAGWEIHNARMGGDPVAPQGAFEYQDVRDDRVLTYFTLGAGDSKTFTTLMNAAYMGSYYLPSVSVAAMYDATTFARTAGYGVRVEEPVR
jgi:hypothetical protein